MNALIAEFRSQLVSGKQTMPVSDLVECIKISLAAQKARETGREIFLEDLSYNDDGFDGTAFAKTYRLAKWKGEY